MPYKKPKRSFDASLLLDTYILFSENISCAYTSYSRMLLISGYVGYADYIKKLFAMSFYTNWARK